jgi:hypothetical protein
MDKKGVSNAYWNKSPATSVKKVLI